MKVLHVIRSFRPETGGLVEAVGQLGPALRALGHESHTISLDPADAVRRDPDVTVLGRHSHGFGRTPEFGPWLRARHRDFDAVVVHGLWQFQGYATWRTLRGTSTPYFVFCHGMLDPWFKRSYPLKHLKKWLYWPWAEYRVLRDATGVCFTSEEERRAARRSFWLYRARELIVPFGIAAPPGEAATQRELFFSANPGLRGRPFLLFLGRIHPKKGLEHVFRAYAAQCSVVARAPALAIVGPCADDGYLQGLKALTVQLGIAHSVHWPGMATGGQKWGALRACDGFFLLSHQENFGMAVLEALACGKPVLLSRQINIWREIVDDGAGWAAADSEAGAAEILGRWQALTPDARAAMGLAALRCYQTRFEARTAAGKLVEVLGQAIRAAGPIAPVGGETVQSAGAGRGPSR